MKRVEAKAIEGSLFVQFARQPQKLAPPDFEFVLNVVVVAVVHDAHFLIDTVAVSDDEIDKSGAHLLITDDAFVAFGAWVFDARPTLGKGCPREYLLAGGAPRRGRRLYADAPVELADVGGLCHWVNE